MILYEDFHQKKIMNISIKFFTFFTLDGKKLLILIDHFSHQKFETISVWLLAEIYEAFKYADAYIQQADRKIAKHIQGHN